jgi:hypothetical protein
LHKGQVHAQRGPKKDNKENKCNLKSSSLFICLALYIFGSFQRKILNAYFMLLPYVTFIPSTRVIIKGKKKINAIVYSLF